MELAEKRMDTTVGRDVTSVTYTAQTRTLLREETLETRPGRSGRRSAPGSLRLRRKRRRGPRRAFCGSRAL